MRTIEKTEANMKHLYDLWLAHWSVHDLAKEFRLHTTEIKAWLEEATALWDDELNVSTQLCQKRVIAQVNATIKDAKKQFIRSCEDEVIRKFEKQEGGEDGPITKRSKTRKGQSGNPMYLSVIHNGLKMLQQIHGAKLSTNISELVADLPYEKAQELEQAIKEICGDEESIRIARPGAAEPGEGGTVGDGGEGPEES